MGRTIRCPECGEVFRELEAIEELRDNDGACVVCNNPIEVADWDRVLASYEDDDYDDVDAIGDDDDDEDDDSGGGWDDDDAVDIDDDGFDDDDEDLDDEDDDDH